MNIPTPNQQNSVPVKTHSYQIQDIAERDYSAPTVEANIKAAQKNAVHISTPNSSTQQSEPVYFQQSSPETTGHSREGHSWVPIYKQLENEIKLRHYSPKTLKAYRTWTRQFQGDTKSNNYQDLYQ